MFAKQDGRWTDSEFATIRNCNHVITLHECLWVQVESGDIGTDNGGSMYSRALLTSSTVEKVHISGN